MALTITTLSVTLWNYAEYHAERGVLFMVMLNVIMLCVIMLCVIVLYVIMLYVIMLCHYTVCHCAVYGECTTSRRMNCLKRFHEKIFYLSCIFL